ncbi:MAG: hypothetical protein ACPGO7_04825 [Alphaproteobacteria bacterium]
MTKQWHRLKRLPIAVQAMHLKREYPLGELISDYKGLRWISDVRPRPHSLKYKVQLVYAHSVRRPVVRILEPNLRLISEGKRVPHLFNQEKQTLCLHYHGVWKPNTLLAETIIPWTVMWTEYFEWWLATDKWHGDEVVHQGAKR